MESQYDGGAGLFALGAMFFFMIGLFLVIHLFYGYCLKLIAEKSGHGESAGLWWVPIVNLLIPLKIANKPTWWLALFFVPIVNFVVGIIVMMEVAKARGKDPIWGILAVVVGIVGVSYLAFSD